MSKGYEKILFKFKSAWDTIKENDRELVYDFSKNYKTFLDNGKTERECVKEIVKLAEKNGFINIEDFLIGREPIKEGKKIFVNYKGKAAALLVVGKDLIEKGMNIVAAHIDSPRLDLKPFPLYEEEGLALFKTHYYGGIKKYQWTSLPLAFHGVVINKQGEKNEIVIGEHEDDPVFYITDLLPHLAKEQHEKKLGEGITGEGLNVLIGSIPYDMEEKEDRVKCHIMNLLNEKYGFEEDDFIAAEIEVVPAVKAKDVGFDRSMIGAYGQDDRVCAFAALRAILEVENPKRTAVGLFVDKEEVGSVGNTGMYSKFFENMVAELISLQSDNYNDLMLRRAMAETKVLSADVGAAFDPNYPDVLDKRNAAFAGKGVIIVKYTGTRGKSSTNDANAEFLNEIRNLFNANEIQWQIGELGKVDQGGGGTIAYILANYGAEVVDCGVPVLSMHSPLEIVSKIDIYMAYKAYKAFMKN